MTLLFLIGYRGTGKTTVARLLAGRLGRHWVDADDEIERRHGRTVRELFSQEGEAGFREKEEAVLADLCRLEDHVVATGGGAVLRESNRRRLRESGRVVWLTADPATIWERMQADPCTPERRPALRAGGLAEIEEVLRVREPFYRACADLVVATAGRLPEEVAEMILAQVAPGQEARNP